MDFDPKQMGQMAGMAGTAVDAVGGPLGLVGRVAGLGADELDAGVPGWAWLGIGILVGGVGAYLLHDRIERIVKP